MGSLASPTPEGRKGRSIMDLLLIHPTACTSDSYLPALEGFLCGWLCCLNGGSLISPPVCMLVAFQSLSLTEFNDRTVIDRCLWPSPDPRENIVPLSNVGLAQSFLDALDG